MKVNPAKIGADEALVLREGPITTAAPAPVPTAAPAPVPAAAITATAGAGFAACSTFDAAFDRRGELRLAGG